MQIFFVAALKVLTVSRTEFISFLMGATAAKTLGAQTVKYCTELWVAGLKLLQFSCAKISWFLVGPTRNDMIFAQENCRTFNPANKSSAQHLTFCTPSVLAAVAKKRYEFCTGNRQNFRATTKSLHNIQPSAHWVFWWPWAKQDALWFLLNRIVKHLSPRRKVMHNTLTSARLLFWWPWAHKKRFDLCTRKLKNF